MLAPVPSHLSHFNIKLDGQQASPEVMNDLLECTVESSLQLPDYCTFRIHDAEFKWLDKETFREGTKVEISGGQETTSVLTPLFHGEVTALEMDLAGHGAPTLVLRCYDRSHRLHRGRSSRSFIQMKDSDIVQKVGSEEGFTVHAESTSQVHEWVLQNNQTNWEFLNERADQNGYWLYVQGEKDLYFRKVKDQGDSTLTLEWGKNLRSFRPRTAAGPQVDEVIVRSWDPKNKEAIVGRCSKPSGVPQIGDATHGGDIAKKAYGRASMVVVDHPVHSQGEAEDLARSVCDRIGGGFIEAEGLCHGEPGLKPGMMVAINNIGKRFSGKYHITTTAHTYTPAEGYSTVFTVSGKQSSSVLGLLDASDASTKSRLGGNIVVGIVTDNKDPDNLGRVKVRYPWLTPDHTSYWVRPVSPMAGAGRGFLFLPEIDDEVLVAFEHGDIRRAYLLGSLWNGKDKPAEGNDKAVSGGKVNRRTITTRIGHTMLLDDTDGKGEVSLTTKDGRVLVLDDANQKIVVKDKNGNTITIQSGNNSIQMECLGDFTVSAKGKVSIEGTQGIEIKTPAMMNLEATGPATVKSDAVLTVQGSLVKIN